MTQRELLDQCVRLEMEFEVTLRSGVRFLGTARGHSDGQLEMKIEGGYAFVLMEEIAAVTVYREPAIANEADLLDRVRKLNGRVQVEVVWKGAAAGPGTLDAAMKMFEIIFESLAVLGAESSVSTVRLLEMELGRFCVEEGVLEAGFSAEQPPLPARELQSLLAAIL